MNPVENSSFSALKCPQCGANIVPTAETTIICQYCGTTLIAQPGSGPSGEAGPQLIRGMRLKMTTCADPQVTGLEVFRMLMPVGWQSQGGCSWALDNPGMPGTISFRIWNPQGAEGFEIFPAMNFVWNNNPMARLMTPTGSRYFGAEVRPISF